jgi:hypothetical protein
LEVERATHQLLIERYAEPPSEPRT